MGFDLFRPLKIDISLTIRDQELKIYIDLLIFMYCRINQQKVGLDLLINKLLLTIRKIWLIMFYKIKF